MRELRLLREENAKRLAQISRSLYAYRSCRPTQEALRKRMCELAPTRRAVPATAIGAPRCAACTKPCARALEHGFFP